MKKKQKAVVEELPQTEPVPAQDESEMESDSEIYDAVMRYHKGCLDKGKGLTIYGLALSVLGSGKKADKQRAAKWTEWMQARGLLEPDFEKLGRFYAVENQTAGVA